MAMSIDAAWMVDCDRQMLVREATRSWLSGPDVIPRSMLRSPQYLYAKRNRIRKLVPSEAARDPRRKKVGGSLVIRVPSGQSDKHRGSRSVSEKHRASTQ